MKLLIAVAVIGLASVTATFADPGTGAPTNLNAANQSEAMSRPGTAGQDLQSNDMQGRAGIQRPVRQGAMNIDVARPADVKAKSDAKIDQAKMAKSSDGRVMPGSKQDEAERAQTQQLNDQQLAAGAGRSGQPATISPQTAAKPPEGNKTNCIEGTARCTPAIPRSDH